MPLTVADLDRICKHCGQSIRAHCSEADGVWYYTPCSQTLIVMYPIIKDHFAADGTGCVHCGKDAKSHFAFRSPIVTVSLRKKTTDIQPAGKIVVYEVAKAIGCGYAAGE